MYNYRCTHIHILEIVTHTNAINSCSSLQGSLWCPLFHSENTDSQKHQYIYSFIPSVHLKWFHDCFVQTIIKKQTYKNRSGLILVSCSGEPFGTPSSRAEGIWPNPVIIHCFD